MGWGWQHGKRKEQTGKKEVGAKRTPGVEMFYVMCMLSCFLCFFFLFKEQVDIFSYIINFNYFIKKKISFWGVCHKTGNLTVFNSFAVFIKDYIEEGESITCKGKYGIQN